MKYFRKTSYLTFFVSLVFVLVLSGCTTDQISPAKSTVQVDQNQKSDNPTTSPEVSDSSQEQPAAAPKNQESELYSVTSVVDGDTFKVSIDGKVETLRMIGIDTPETVDPRKPVQCFGKEASDYAKKLLTGKRVRLEADSTQGERDKYDRLLRYAYLEDGTFFNKTMIAEGYAHEYTYNAQYKYQAEFKKAEADARNAKRGLLADNACPTTTTPTPTPTPSTSSDNSGSDTPTPPPVVETTPTPSAQCLIKGNITSEKIYHLPGCGSYNKTVIEVSKGERWFCTEAEAVAAGWRKALNCP